MLHSRSFRFPHHPLARLLMTVVGIAVFCLLITFSLFIGAVLLGLTIAAWVVRQFSHASVAAVPGASSTAPGNTTVPGVIEGEYVVLSKHDVPPNGTAR